MAVTKTRHKRRLVAEINVVPYIDVMLVLLIVFMITAPLLMQGVQVELPKAPSEPLEETDKEPLVVSIKEDGTYYLNVGDGGDEEPVALSAIEERVGKVLNAQPGTPVMVWGDTGVAYGRVVELMSVLQSAGAPNVGLVTEPPSDMR
mgnify:CR=1 FL=1|jgi:biopolymer transport protein TolR